MFAPGMQTEFDVCINCDGRKTYEPCCTSNVIFHGPQEAANMSGNYIAIILILAPVVIGLFVAVIHTPKEFRKRRT